jgi:hypothetical protein
LAVYFGFGFKSKRNIPLYQEKIKVREKKVIQPEFFKKNTIYYFLGKGYICPIPNTMFMYKKISLAAILVLCLVTVSFSQFNKGDRMIGSYVAGTTFSSGNTDYSYPNSTPGYEAKSNSFALTFSPNYGWFIQSNKVVGITLNAGFNSSKISNMQGGNTFSEYKNGQFNLGIGGFFRNYFSSKSTTVLPFAQASVNFGTGSGTNDGFLYSSDVIGPYKETYDGKSSGVAFLNATLSFGLTKMVTKNTGLDFFAGYTYSYNKKTSKTTTVRTYTGGAGGFTGESEPTEKYTGHGFSLGVGFQIFLEKRK